MRSLIPVGRVALSVVVLSSGCGDTLSGYRAMTIDPDGLAVTLAGEIPTPIGPDGRGRTVDVEYFAPWSGDAAGTRNLEVRHFGPPASPRARYAVYIVSEQKRLISRRKLRAVLNGEFGTVYAHSTFCYMGTPEDTTTWFSTEAYANEAEHESFSVAERLPVPLPRLDAVTIIRVLRSDAYDMIVTADYAPDGVRHAIGVAWTENGNWVHPARVRSIDAFRELSLIAPARYGLPDAFPVAEYLNTARAVWRPDPSAVLDVVSLHYDRGNWVRQDLHAAGAISTRVLTYARSDLDRALDRWEPNGLLQRPGCYY